jgi:hypothetical protein
MMSQKKIKKLTPEQAALIPGYREKWTNIALSTERIDREKAAVAIKEAYNLLGFPKPEIFFCDSPYEAMNTTLPQLEHLIVEAKTSGFSGVRSWFLNKFSTKTAKKPRNIGFEISGRLWWELSSENQYLEEELQSRIAEDLESQIDEELARNICSQLRDELGKLYDKNFIHPVALCSYCCWFDFLTSILNFDTNQQLWQVFQLLGENSGWIFPYQRVVVICDRPTKLHFDSEQQLHREGEPALQFADGYSLYAFHGTSLPEKYGKVHPNLWKAKWLLEEDNAELRRVLIQGIGYARIIQELGANELDSYQEYTLLKIDNEVDIEPIYLLKMTCPSTKYIHALRVPPDVVSAREAIAWVNWGIDPEDFAVQT